MRRFLAALIVGASPGLAGAAAPASAQTGCQTTNLPANTVLGRLGAGQSGPCEAIPFANFFAQIPLTSLPSGLTLPSPNFTGTVTGNGTIPNAVLANSSTTVNGQACALGGTCTISASAGTITEGTTLVAGGSSGDILFNNAGTLGGKSSTGSGNVVLATSPTISAPTLSGHPTIEGVTSTGATGTGAFAFATSPTLVTPVLGVATATSINKNAFTQPATGSTWTLADGKTLTVNKTLTFTGTDGQTFTFPASSDTIPGLGTAQTFSAFQTLTGGIAATGTNLTGAGTITSAQYFVCVALSSGATINLPASPASGEAHLIKDCNGTDATNNITLNGNGNNIDGASTFVMKTSGSPPWDSLAVSFNSTYGWMIN